MRTTRVVVLVIIAVLLLLCLYFILSENKGYGLSGKWIDEGGGWGSVVIVGNRGKYTDTYAEDSGTFEFHKAGKNRFEGTWRESEKRYGTLWFEVSQSGKIIQGKYRASDKCEIEPGTEGIIDWAKE
jgi:hypothetical protein